MTPVEIYLEQGKKKVFACALDWPGWCRAGRDDETRRSRPSPPAPSGTRLDHAWEIEDRTEPA